MISPAHGLVVALCLLALFVVSLVVVMVQQLMPLFRAWSEYWRGENEGARVESKDETCGSRSS